MDNKEKLILAFYIGAKNATPESIADLHLEIKEQLNSEKTLDYLFFILPDSNLNFGSIKLECVNPKVITEIEYKNKVDKIINSIENNLSNNDSE